jgi:uncharacterized membrane protein
MEFRTETVAKAIHQNIETIAKLEGQFNARRSVSDRVADRIASFSGSLPFVVVHAVFFGVWIAANLGMISQIKPWDKYPFMLLTVLVSLEAIFLSAFVLIKQSRMSQRADELAQLDLQINLLAEREMTLVLQMLHGVCQRLNVEAPDQEVRELSEETPVAAMASEVERAILTNGTTTS